MTLLERVRAGHVLVGDGAWGTMLMARGLDPGAPPEAFNLSNVAALEDIARLYLEAGADLVTTNTFGGSPLRLRAHGLEGETEAINRVAVEAVRRTIGDGAYVGASMGPCGRLLKPWGEVDASEVAESFARQARALVSAGVDLVLVETMTDLEEARLAVRAVRAAAPAVPIVATMTFEPTPRGFRTVMGVSVEQAARGLAAAGADLVGSNCGNGVETMVAVAGAFHEVTPGPLVIQSNAGLPESRGGALVYPETPAHFAAAVPALVAAGVQVIGGCCGTTPAHIAAIRAAVDTTVRRARGW